MPPRPPAPSYAAPSGAPVLALGDASAEKKQVQSVSAWIEEQRADEDHGAPLTMIFCGHMPSNREIHHCKLGGSPGRSSADLAALFLGKMKSYAENLPGVQTFMLSAYFGEGKEPGASKPVTVRGATGFDGGVTEAATPAGALAQGMRLSEMHVQGSYHQNASMMQNMLSMVELFARENRELREDNRASFSMVLNLLSEQARIRHDKTMEEEKYRRATEERAMFLKFAPPLVNTIVGKEVFPTGVADTALIEGIAEHLSDEHLHMLASSNIFPPMLWGPLSARLTEIVKKKEAAQLQLQRATAAATPALSEDSDEGGNA